jgi:hypothetical protein
MSEKCGTHAGWNQHMRDGTPVCAPCRKAKTDYTREYRHRTGQPKGTWIYVPDQPELTDDHYCI